MDIPMDIERISQGAHYPASLDFLIKRFNHSQLKTKLPECVQRAIEAEKLCSAYPHLDKEVVMISLLLLELYKEGCFHGGLQEVSSFLSDNMQRFKIMNVMIEAQTGYATGEAKIVQYYCH